MTIAFKCVEEQNKKKQLAKRLGIQRAFDFHSTMTRCFHIKLLNRSIFRIGMCSHLSRPPASPKAFVARGVAHIHTCTHTYKHTHKHFPFESRNRGKLLSASLSSRYAFKYSLIYVSLFKNQISLMFFFICM